MKTYNIGRENSNDVFIPAENVSRCHAILIINDNGEMYIQDNNSLNGLFLHSETNRISRSRITKDDLIFLGSYPLPMKRILEQISLKNPPSGSVRMVRCICCGSPVQDNVKICPTCNSTLRK